MGRPRGADPEVSVKAAIVHAAFKEYAHNRMHNMHSEQPVTFGSNDDLAELYDLIELEKLKGNNMLTVISTHEVALSKAAKRRLWECFLKGGTNHSPQASTLPYILRRCEQEGQRYTLDALPGQGYFIKPREGKS